MPHSSLWPPANQDALLDYVDAIRQHYRLSPEQVLSALSTFSLTPEQSPVGSTIKVQKDRAFRDMLERTTSKPRDKSVLTLLFWWAENICATTDIAGLQEDDRTDRFRQLAASINLAMRRHTKRSPAAADVANVLGMVTTLLKLSGEDLRRLETSIFRHEDMLADGRRAERHFLCYRLHSEPDHIAKSFLSIFGRDKEVPGVCRFANFFCDLDGSKREANGIVLPFPLGNYFIGQTGGSGMKLMTVRDLSKKKTRHSGLLVSADCSAGVVATRVLLVDTPIRHSSQTDIGVFPQDRLKGDEGFDPALLLNEADRPSAAPIVLQA